MVCALQRVARWRSAVPRLRLRLCVRPCRNGSGNGAVPANGRTARCLAATRGQWPAPLLAPP
jgi:hypothetical protein